MAGLLSQPLFFNCSAVVFLTENTSFFIVSGVSTAKIQHRPMHLYNKAYKKMFAEMRWPFRLAQHLSILS